MRHPVTNRHVALLDRSTARGLAAYRAARQTACEEFSSTSRIQPLWRRLTNTTDELLQTHAPAEVCVIAVGGYGRRELFPHSDVDILLLLPDDTAQDDSQVLIGMLQQLWDMHIPVSHAVRTIAETVVAAKTDHSIAAALMDARLISGDRKNYLTLKQQLRQNVYGLDKRTFVEDKLRDRDTRHRKWGDSRFVLEPNIKEGKGGLRDLHTLMWLARYCYGVTKAGALVRDDLLTHAEWQHYRHAYLFYAVVRAHVHILRGRADERLTFDLQTQIATCLKFRGRTAQEKASRLMLRYFQFSRQVGTLTRVFCTILEEENHRTVVAPFVAETLVEQMPSALVVEAGRLNLAAHVSLADAPVEAVRLFASAQQFGLDIHPRAYLAISRALPSMARTLLFEGIANALVRSILLGRAPDTSLRRMNECGLLGVVLPEFGRIVGMMQYDGYHTYTVDEHTLVAIGNLAMIEAGGCAEENPLAHEVAHEIKDREALYLAMLGHDLAKGTGGAHARKGEGVITRIATRWGTSAATSEMAGWLVAHHLIFSDTAFRRDLDDPKTIVDFVDAVQSPERLRMLLLMTVADIKAVGPTIWNGRKGALMRALYQRAMAYMGVTCEQIVIKESPEFWANDPDPLIQNAAQHFYAMRTPTGWTQRLIQEQRACLTAYGAWLGQSQEVALITTHDAFRAVTELTCCVQHQPGLFRILAGVMALSGASIVGARIMVLGDGAAIANLAIQDIHGNSFASESKRLAELPRIIHRALMGQLKLDQELPRSKRRTPLREMALEPSVFVDNQVSTTASVIEVNARDRLGLLHAILGALETCQLQVMTAHIATYGARAVDVFYVKDAYGLKIIHQDKMAAVEQALLAAITGEGP